MILLNDEKTEVLLIETQYQLNKLDHSSSLCIMTSILGLVSPHFEYTMKWHS